MRWWLSIIVAAAGCDGETALVRDGSPDAELHQTARFTPLLCTSGSPGDPTCPLTIVDVGELAAGTRLEMVVEPLATGFYLRDIKLTPGPTGLHVERLQLVVWRDGVAYPQLGPFPAVIELTTEPLIIESAAVQTDIATSQLGLQYGATR